MRPFRFWQPGLWLALATILLVVMSQFAIAAPDRAPVMLDGRVLFEVGESEGFSARDRAQLVNEALAAEVQVPKAQRAAVKVVPDDGLTLIQAGERYLLTVTETDVQNAPRPFSQAKKWSEQLQAALNTAYYQRTFAYQWRALVDLTGIAIATGLLLWQERRLTRRGLKRLGHWLNQPESPWFDWAQPIQMLVRVVNLAVQVAIAYAAFYFSSDLLPQTRIWRYRLYQVWNEPLITLGAGVSKSIADIVALALVSVLVWFVVSGVSRWLKLYIFEQVGHDNARYELLATAVQYVLLFLALITLLPIWGINLTSLAIFGSFLGVGLGFGAQNIVNNFVSGLIIAIERPIKVGDFVTVNNFQGTVTQVGARSTTIRTQDRVTIIVPNSRFLETEVVNRSYDDPISRLHIPVGVAYHSPIKLVRQALLDAATQHREVLLRPAPQVWFIEFGESSLNFELLVWTAHPKEQPRLKSELNYRIEANLRKYGIEIPFPQRDLNLRSPQLNALFDAQLAERGIALSEPPPPDYDLDFLDHAREFAGVGQLTSWDIENLVAAMRGEAGVNIQDRRYRLSVYPRCFVGSEAVEWLMDYQKCDRDTAIAIGRLLSDRGIIHHIADEHPFRDAFLFYRFYADEVAL